QLRRPGYGNIVRTVSGGLKEDEIRYDVEFLNVMWQDVMKKRDQQPAPTLLNTDLTLTFRVVRDLFTKKVKRLLIDSKQEYEAVRYFVHRSLSEQTSRVHHYDKDQCLF